MTLEQWGWDATWAEHLGTAASGANRAARVTGHHRDRWSVQTELGAASARQPSAGRIDGRPVVGDWVEVKPGPMPNDPWSIIRILPRRSRFSRGAAGSSAAEQVLAANVDRVWIVHGLDSPFNPRKLERYLAVAWESGGVPEVVLTKADLTGELEVVVAAVQQVAIGVPIWVTSTVTEAGTQSLRESLLPARTIALLGPSGAGKSTLINALAAAAVAATGVVRPTDHKGRHTTTHRELFLIAGGALLLDTPGLRELRVWDLDEGLEQTFPEIEQLAHQCRYRDCRHQSEPGCAVIEASGQGKLDPGRLDSFRKLRAEAAFQQRKIDPLARAAAVSQHKAAMKTLKYHPKYRDGG